MLELIAAFAVGIVGLCLIAKIIAIPARLLWNFITNSIVGAVLLALVKLFLPKVAITILTALIAGVFGIPGVLAVVVYSYF